MSNKIADQLRTVLASSYGLYFKTHSFHWNVEGMNFKELHELFEVQYTAIWNSLDEIAERIRSVGDYAPSNTEQLVQGSIISDESKPSNAKQMLDILVADYNKIITLLKDSIKLSEQENDPISGDLFTQLLAFYEKNIWMLKSTSK